MLAAQLAGAAQTGAEIESAATAISAALARLESNQAKVVPGTAQDILSELLAEIRQLQRVGDTVVAATKKDSAAVAIVAPDVVDASAALAGTAKVRSTAYHYPLCSLTDFIACRRPCCPMVRASSRRSTVRASSRAQR